VWSRSAGSYELIVSNCPYTGSDLYEDATHLCQLRSSGAQNWEAWIKDARDNELYRIVLMPDNNWWLAQNIRWNEGAGICYQTCTDYGLIYPYSSLATVCPANWTVPNNDQFNALIISVGGSSVAGGKLAGGTSWDDLEGNSNSHTDDYGFTVVYAPRCHADNCMFYGIDTQHWSSSPLVGGSASGPYKGYSLEVTALNNTGRVIEHGAWYIYYFPVRCRRSL
jgi:uncharacterized protein (TIGR02145 family)